LVEPKERSQGKIERHL